MTEADVYIAGGFRNQKKHTYVILEHSLWNLVWCGQSWYVFKDKKYIIEVLKKTEKKINRKILLVDQIDPFEEKLLIYDSK